MIIYLRFFLNVNVLRCNYYELVFIYIKVVHLLHQNNILSELDTPASLGNPVAIYQIYEEYKTFLISTYVFFLTPKTKNLLVRLNKYYSLYQKIIHIIYFFFQDNCEIIYCTYFSGFYTCVSIMIY